MVRLTLAAPGAILPGVNHAFVDGSYADSGENAGIGGWGIVLLLAGQPPRRIQGRSQAADNNATELRAVLEALRSAPAGEPLTVHSDNTNTIRSVQRGSLSLPQDELAATIRQEAQERGVPLHVARASRERRHMQAAHELANDARQERATPEPVQVDAEVIIDQLPWRAQARLSVRRPGERVTVELPLDPAAMLPPTAQALLGAVGLAQAGETLLVRRASRLAQAIWEKPLRALEGEARGRVEAAREAAAERAVTVLFGL